MKTHWNLHQMNYYHVYLYTHLTIHMSASQPSWKFAINLKWNSSYTCTCNVILLLTYEIRKLKGIICVDYSSIEELESISTPILLSHPGFGYWLTISRTSRSM